MARILVIDDDEEIVESVTALLETHGHAITAARSGSEGFQEALRARPDLVLLDVMMATDSEGFEVARRLQEDPGTRGTPVILITGIRRAKTLPFAYEPDDDWLPVQAVLEKPVAPDALLAAVGKALGAKSG